jgi:hypothetical protein
MIILLIGGAVTGFESAEAQTDIPKILIRPKYIEGRELRYRLQLSGEVDWTPKSDEFPKGEMSTDFTFTLAARAVRRNGSCTFSLVGEKLESEGDGPNGRFSVTADQNKAKIKVDGKWRLRPETPFSKPMTVTLGPLGEYRFSTGLAPIAIYALPHVDRRFWNALTLAPLVEVGPGDAWEQQLNLPVPGAEGQPLTLKARWKVLGEETYGRQNVIALGLEAQLDIKDSELLLKNGEQVHLEKGQYQAAGKVLWDVEHGILCYASAEQRIRLQTDKPSRRRLESQASSTMELLSFKDKE